VSRERPRRHRQGKHWVGNPNPYPYPNPNPNPGDRNPLRREGRVSEPRTPTAPQARQASRRWAWRGAAAYSDEKGCESQRGGFRVGEIAHAAASRRPPIPLSTIVARTNMYTYDANVWGLSIVQGPFSVAPRQTPDVAIRNRVFFPRMGCTALSPGAVRRWGTGRWFRGAPSARRSTCLCAGG
jgi:hypothetical protein